MNVRRKIVRQKDILGKKEKPQYEVSPGIEEDIEIVATFTLQGKQIWTGETMLSIVGSYERFKENVFVLAEKDSEYKHWLQTTGQNELAGEWGIDQSTISRLIGPIQREHKNDLKAQARLLRADGMSLKSIIDELQLDIDESTVSRWLKRERLGKSRESKRLQALEGSTEYDLKIYKLEDELKREKKKSEAYRKEIKVLKDEVNALLAKYEGA